MKSKYWWLLSFAVALLAAGGIWFFKPPAPPMPPGPNGGGPNWSAEQIRLLHELRIQGIGHLENEKFEDASTALRTIISSLPHDPLGPRNLAVNEILAFEKKPASPAAALEATAALVAHDDRSAVAHFLQAKLQYLILERAVEPADRDTAAAAAIAALQKAAELDSGNAAIQYSMFKAGEHAEDEKLRSLARQALGRAHAAQPQNLFVLADWLLVQADEQDAKVAETLEAARPTLAAVREGIRERTSADVFDFLDRAIAAAGKGEWNVVLANVRPLANVLRPEEYAQSDLRLVQPHLAEFILHDFAAEFYQQHPLPPVAATAEHKVRWAEWPPEKPLPPMNNLVDVALVDFDLDGRLDVVALATNRVEVFSRRGENDAWTSIAAAEVPAGMRRLLLADLDRDAHQPSVSESDPPEEKNERNGTDENDGIHNSQDSHNSHGISAADPDLIAVGVSGVIVLRNDLAGSPSGRSLTPIEPPHPFGALNLTAATLIDYDHDGDLDFIAAGQDGVSMWANLGNMTFEDQTSRSQVGGRDWNVHSMTAVDWDRDLDLDVVVAGTAEGSVGLLENLRHGQFRWRPFRDSLPGILPQAASLAVLEADGNVSWDLLAAEQAALHLTLTTTLPSRSVRELRTGSFARTTDAAAPASETAAATENSPFPHRLLIADFDNDSFNDALAIGDRQPALWFGGPDGKFSAAESIAAALPGGAWAADVGDLDGDGDLDAAFINQAGIRLVENAGESAGRWLDVRLKGAVDNKSGRVNDLGLGSLLEMRTGDQYRAATVVRPITHFGLAGIEQADSLRILMTNGIPQAVVRPESNRLIVEEMALKGSCPYAYTWTGERFEFFTDLLWAAPLGLQSAGGGLVPARPWEFLKIPGEQLVAKDGRYSIQVTEELWEAAYFDQIELIAIDHPADIEIYSNEKVGPPSIAEFKIHTMRERRSPMAARDAAGRDVLPDVSARDGRYFQGFSRRFCQGLVDEHFLELDLGELPNPKTITLFLTGWIYPTDTSLNVAIQQNPQWSPLQPPSVWVPDADGQWRQAIPFMGFPGGKPKTIAVDLSGIFAGGDHRLRIATSHELYWDEAFFTLDGTAVDGADFTTEARRHGVEVGGIRQTKLPLQSADLHYRGFSRVEGRRDSTPEKFYYDDCSTAAKWPPMFGRFTRYGDVRELLTATDDKLLVMSSGDEVTLSFAAGEPPPPGWTRDFILHNVGWDKDADLNTVYGQTVEPLPFVGMSRYPLAPDEPTPAGRDYEDYLRRFQTRQSSFGDFWRK